MCSLKKAGLSLFVSLAIVSSLTGCSGEETKQAASPAGKPVIKDGEDWSLPAAVQPASYSGFYNMDMETPTAAIGGVGGTLTWQELNPSENVYNFSRLERLLKTGGKVAIRLKSSEVQNKFGGAVSGPYMPKWVMDKYSPAQFYTFGSEGASQYIRYAAFWDRGVQEEYKRFVEEFGRRGFFAYPNFVGVYLHAVSSSRGEEFHVDEDHRDDIRAAGLTSAGLVAAMQDRMTWWAKAAGANSYKIAWVGAGEVGLPYDQDALNRYAMELGMGLRGGFIEHYFNAPYSVPSNGLSYKNGYVEVDWNHPIRSKTRYYADENEETDEFKGAAGYAKTFSYQTTYYRAAQLGMNHLWVSNGTLSEAGGVPEWYRRVAGKRPNEAPDAVAWLRQAEVRLRETAGAPLQQKTWKNLEHLLMQRDIGDGYQTVVDQADYLNLPYTSLKVKGQEGEYSARRTDKANGQDKIAFFLHDEFESSITGATEVKVTYQDSGAAVWKLKASTAAGIVEAGAVTNTDSGIWKTAKFTVASPIKGRSLPDGIDLMLETSAGDLKVRFVRVIKQY